MGFIDKMAGLNFAREISLQAVPPEQRRAAVERALERLSALGRERFPSSEGYAHADKDMLAAWAWPKGAQDEAEARKYAGAETVALAKRRSVTVRRGMTRGITLDLSTMDRAQSKLELRAHLETRLSMVLAMAVLAACTLGASGLAFVAQGERWRVRPIVIAGFVGLVIGGLLAVLSLRVSKMVEAVVGDPIKPDEGQQHFDEIVAGLRAG